MLLTYSLCYEIYYVLLFEFINYMLEAILPKLVFKIYNTIYTKTLILFINKPIKLYLYLSFFTILT